jgi:hypothetical protein
VQEGEGAICPAKPHHSPTPEAPGSAGFIGDNVLAIGSKGQAEDKQQLDASSLAQLLPRQLISQVFAQSGKVG